MTRPHAESTSSDRVFTTIVGWSGNGSRDGKSGDRARYDRQRTRLQTTGADQALPQDEA